MQTPLPPFLTRHVHLVADVVVAAFAAVVHRDAGVLLVLITLSYGH